MTGFLAQIMNMTVPVTNLNTTMRETMAQLSRWTYVSLSGENNGLERGFRSIWFCGEEYNRRGEEQLVAYLESYHAQRGYLLSFNFKKQMGSSWLYKTVMGYG